MRKAVLLLSALFLFYLSYTQTRFGLKAGANIATIGIGAEKWAAERDNKNWRIGFNTGAFMRASLSRRLFVQPELLYSLKGYGIKATPYNPDGTNSLHYVTVPLLAGFTLSDRFSLVAGPEFGYLISARSKYDGGWGPGNLHDFKDFDLGADLGITYKVNDLLGIDLRYNHGLKDLAEGPLVDRYGQLQGYYKEGRTRAFQAGIHYLFPRK